MKVVLGSVLVLFATSALSADARWSKEQESRLSGACIAAVVNQTGAPIDIANKFCACVVKEVEKAVPVYNEQQIMTWLDSAAGHVKTQECAVAATPEPAPAAK